MGLSIGSLFRSSPMATDKAFNRVIEKASKSGEVKLKYLEKLVKRVGMSSQTLNTPELRAVLRANAEISQLLMTQADKHNQTNFWSW